MASIAERLAAHGFHFEETGGGCTAYVRRDERDGLEELIVSEEAEMEAPTRLDEVCTASLWKDGDFADASAPLPLAAILRALDHPSEDYALLVLRLYNGLHREEGSDAPPHAD